MTNVTSPADLETLRKIIDDANQKYNTDGTSPLTDEEFDALMDQLRLLAPDDPRLIRVGAPPANSPLTKVKHQLLMGSLFKVTSEDDLKKWHTKLNSPPLFASTKCDGISLALYYRQGVFKQAVKPPTSTSIHGTRPFSAARSRTRSRSWTSRASAMKCSMR